MSDTASIESWQASLCADNLNSCILSWKTGKVVEQGEQQQQPMKQLRWRGFGEDSNLKKRKLLLILPSLRQLLFCCYYSIGSCFLVRLKASYQFLFIRKILPTATYKAISLLGRLNPRHKHTHTQHVWHGITTRTLRSKRSWSGARGLRKKLSCGNKKRIGSRKFH